MKLALERLWYHWVLPIWYWMLRPINRIRYAHLLRWAIYDAECQCEIANFATPQEADTYLFFLGGGQYYIWPTFKDFEVVSNTPNPDWSLTFKQREV